jgi:hypothetical protein
MAVRGVGGSGERGKMGRLVLSGTEVWGDGETCTERSRSMGRWGDKRNKGKNFSLVPIAF